MRSARDNFAPFRTGGVVHQTHRASLVCRVRDLRFAIPLEHVGETMRPLPVERLSGVPPSVTGLALVRGAPTPVVDVAVLLQGQPSVATRFVTVKAGGRMVALAVDEVAGVVSIPLASLAALPPLFQSAGLDAIAAIGTLDADLLIVLRDTGLLSDELWAAM